ncbi:lipoprotein [Streptomyces seoulensis]
MTRPRGRNGRPAKRSAVAADAGPVVLHLGGLDSGEHDEMIPAYGLAKRTLRAT